MSGRGVKQGDAMMYVPVLCVENALIRSGHFWWTQEACQNDADDPEEQPKKKRRSLWNTSGFLERASTHTHTQEK